MRSYCWRRGSWLGSLLVFHVVIGWGVSALALPTAAACAGGVCGESWEWANPLPQGNYFRSVAWGGGIAVAVGDRGTILTSNDGVTWTPRISHTESDLSRVVFDGLKFVAVGSPRIYLTSPDGITWRMMGYGTGAGPNGLTWTGSMFVGVGDGAVVWTSRDGVNWGGSFSPYSGLSGNLYDVTWTGSQLVTVGEGGRIFTSPDGVKWTQRSSGTGWGLNAVSWLRSQLFAVGVAGTVLTSTDGIVWKPRSTGSNAYFTGVTWTGSSFVLIGAWGEVFSSPDGDRWTRQTSGTKGWLYGVVWTGTQLVVVGEGGMVLTSPDGVSWMRRTSGSIESLERILWTGAKLVTVGRSGAILTSADGTSWESQICPTSEGLLDVTWTGSQFVAVGFNGAIVTSPDGVSWTNRSVETKCSLKSVVWTGSFFVAVGGLGGVFTSPDGAVWTPQSFGVIKDLNGVCWTGSELIAVGFDGLMLTSPDGVLWTPRKSGTTHSLYAIRRVGTQLIALSSSGTILVSANGESWTERRVGGWYEDLGDVISVNSELVVAGADGIHTSPDGIKWTTQVTPAAYLSGVAWTGSQLVVIGSSGTILRSPCEGPALPYSTWVPVSSHASGVNQSQWRTDLGLLNTGTAAANAEVRYYVGVGVATSAASVAAGAQSILVDIVGQVGGSGSGALEVRSDQPLKITSRTYNQSTSGTFGQGYDAITTAQGLSAGQSAWLPHLAENASYRSNIGLTNTGTARAAATVELHDGSGALLTSYDVGLDAGEWKQETQPFKSKTGQTNMARGYAKVRVTSGAGVVAYASLIDNATNDPTTVAMMRADGAMASPSAASSRASSVWVPVASHASGMNQSQWRTDLGLLSTGAIEASAEVRFYRANGVLASTALVAPRAQSTLTDVVGQLGGSGSGALEVRADQPFAITSRTYNQSANGTFGQGYDARTTAQGLGAEQIAWLPHLSENSSYRSNIGLTNTGTSPASVTVELYDGSGVSLTSYGVTLKPGEWKQETQPFRTKAGQTAMTRGYAKVMVSSGSGVIAYASLIDNATNDPTTIAMMR
jgi:hypothetical protein